MGKKLKIKLITYNVGDKGADEVVPSELIKYSQTKEFDFVFIGLQEVVNDTSWTSLIKRTFGEHDYVLFKVRNIWGIWLYGLIKRSLLPHVDDVESETTASGYAGVLGNKGGVTIRLRYNSINIAVVNAHFTAHEECFKDRLNDYLDIITNQKFRDKEVNNLLDHDFIFWMGDLNFRIENMTKEEIENCVRNKQFSVLYQNDQLNKAMKMHGLFKHFQEGTLSFPPTFKYDDNCDVYDTSKKQRKPAWTDRILFLKQEDDRHSALKLKINKYYCFANDRGSDHRPVCAEFLLEFKELYRIEMPIKFQSPIKGVWNGETDEEVEYHISHSCLEHIIDSVIASNKVDNNTAVEVRNKKSHFRPDKWDYLILLPANWVSFNDDIITYTYVPSSNNFANSNHISVEYSRKYLTSIPKNTKLQLVYFSKKMNWLQGYSDTFMSTN